MKRYKIVLLTLIVITSGIFVKAQEKAISDRNEKKEQKDIRTDAAFFYKKIGEQRNPQILDARSVEEFEQAHLPNAVQIDPSVLGYEKHFDNFNKSKPIFIYSIQTGRSTKIANLLLNRGFASIYVLSPGISAWIGAGYPVEVSADNKNRIVLNDFKAALKSQEYVLVDFGSNYCPPCKKVIPVLDSLNHNPNNRIKTILVEIDANPDIIKDFKITAIPTIILYKDGNPVWKKVGIPTVSEIVAATSGQ